MDFYDILREGCRDADSLSSVLGFKKFLVQEKDYTLSDLDAKGANKEADVLVGNDTNRLAKSTRYNAFIVPRNLAVDRFLVSRIKDADAVLCLPLDSITVTYGFVRARNIRMMRNLYSYARSKRVRISIASFAQSKRFMNSREQLLALAKLITRSDQSAKEAIAANALLLKGRASG